MSDRLDTTFARCREAGRTAFIAYLCAGDPDKTTSLALCRALLEGGVDVLELGVPFSDPLADGPVNQLAAQRALENGMTQAHTLDLVRKLREDFDQPIIFYTYYNLIHHLGCAAYAKALSEAGVDGVLALDCPPEEADELVAACRAEDLANIFIVAPTTPEERLPRIVKNASGFLYYVSRLGVTGARDDLASDLCSAVKRIQAHTELPIAVGFGISKPEHVREIGALADGVVVGSALVKIIEENLDQPAELPRLMRERLAYLLGETL